LLGEWKEEIAVPIYKKGVKTDCSNCRGISLLSATYKTLFNVLFSRLTPFAQGIIAYHQGGFPRKRSTTDDMFCICRILEENGNTMK